MIHQFQSAQTSEENHKEYGLGFCSKFAAHPSTYQSPGILTLGSLRLPIYSRCPNRGNTTRAKMRLRKVGVKGLDLALLPRRHGAPISRVGCQFELSTYSRWCPIGAPFSQLSCSGRISSTQLRASNMSHFSLLNIAHDGKTVLKEFS